MASGAALGVRKKPAEYPRVAVCSGKGGPAVKVELRAVGKTGGQHQVSLPCSAQHYWV